MNRKQRRAKGTGRHLMAFGTIQGACLVGCGWECFDVGQDTFAMLRYTGCPDCGGPVVTKSADGPYYLSSTSNHPSHGSVDSSAKSERTPRRGSAHAKGELTSDD